MKTWLSVGAVVVLAACASAPSDGTTRDRNVITAEEISGHHATDAYQLVQRLRPAWLRTRGRNSIRSESTIRVYVNGMSFGDLSSLRQISMSDIVRLERLGAAEATQRFGTGHTNGAILISTH